ncbi:uroporphyrinogen-III synthase [Sphingomonas vulcanisoli]|uniref:Uroporphyrinogen-III synthase n=1 Tax=Sphingomonas vulcanisoli TaxID=1658060 RepID=A0ABX0TRJ9_9SPHN|nr:uroporphyrinogen-III synthase [Sphingomonas vulcanisoli]NIJ08143.1 uroporphyrinogen-III synthase [Sphingomonas vulcanisoli]
MKTLLVLRPEPGAAQTVAAARAMGLDAMAMPLFTIEPVAWDMPAGGFDALMLTSANAVRLGGSGLAKAAHLPVYAVGEATAAAARAAGFRVAYVGSRGAAALLTAMRDGGVRRALHLAGEVHRDAADPEIHLQRVIVYRSVPVKHLPAFPADGVALIHSPNAGCLFARLIDESRAPRANIAIAAISAAAADRVGDGWAAVAVAARPRDAALLAVAAKLCEEAATGLDG